MPQQIRHSNDSPTKSLRRHMARWFSRCLSPQSKAAGDLLGHVPARGIHRILICRATKTLGETLLLSPLLQEIEARFPGAEVDIVSGCGAAPAAAPAEPQRDDAPLLNQAFAPPRPERPESSELEVTHVLPRKDVPSGMVFSWDSAPPAAEPRAVAAEVPATPVARAEISVERMAPEPVAAVQPTSGGVDGPLLEAFLRGLGVPVRLPAGLTPELMEQIGVVLREATQGTLDLLTARALTKREVRAEVTMIVSKGNNPLKFSPDVGFALSQLLAPQGRGFMPPEAAMRDAYDDLRAHQFGFMAGMRAALAGVLKRFEPTALEERVVSRSVLDNILPGSRKARLWDLFEQMYGEISREAEDDFHALFGREFLRAYEEQVERLQAEREPGR